MEFTVARWVCNANNGIYLQEDEHRLSDLNELPFMKTGKQRSEGIN